MMLSCCAWALTGAVEETLPRFVEMGFDRIDVRSDLAEVERVQEQIESWQLRVSCIAASFGMSEGAALSSEDAVAVAAALAHTERGLELGRTLGATTAYVVAEEEGGGAALERYAGSLEQAAELAAELGLKLGVEHLPGRSLPTAAATLGFLRAVGHPNLCLLLDIGHAQMSGEDPAAVIEAAGERLGYVHLDDNDGENDQHLGLLEGVMAEETLVRTFAALEDCGYDGVVSLELSAELPDPQVALVKSREVIERVRAKVAGR